VRKKFPIFVAHLPVLQLMAAATTRTTGENQQSTVKSSNEPVCVKREWMNESEDTGGDLQTLEGRKHNNRTTINNQQSTINLPVPCSYWWKQNKQQSTCSSMPSGILNSCRTLDLRAHNLHRSHVPGPTACRSSVVGTDVLLFHAMFLGPNHICDGTRYLVPGTYTAPLIYIKMV